MCLINWAEIWYADRGYQEQFLDVSKLYKFNFIWIEIDILLKFLRPDYLWGSKS